MNFDNKIYNKLLNKLKNKYFFSFSFNLFKVSEYLINFLIKKFILINKFYFY